MSRRKAAVSGTFYPASCEKIEAMISHFSGMLPSGALDHFMKDVRAVIVPHAGYIYSGFTANAAFRLAARRSDVKRVVVIGPSHRVALPGASVAQFESYETPCKTLAIESTFSRKLEAHYADLSFFSQAHQEHSTEVQMPFIAHYFSDVPVVEIVYGAIDPKALALVIEELLADRTTLLVISTDLSHFYTLEAAGRLDQICIEAIRSMNISMFDQGCEACGLIGVKAMLLAAKNRGLKTEIVDYRTSADASGDTDRVVGYLSAVIG